MQSQATVLLVDDDADILLSLGIHLRADGYRVLRAASGKEALAHLDRELPALAVVDLMMPGMDGLETSRRIKRRIDIPILFLTAVDAAQTKVEALELYADDYVTKPFSYAELAARIARVIKRAWPSGPLTAVVRIDEALTIDFAAQVSTVRGASRSLTPIEARLLQLLYTNAGRVLPTELILDRIWPDGRGEAGYLWEYIRRLRDKLSDDPLNPRYITSERGIGYRFVQPLDEPQTT